MQEIIYIHQLIQSIGLKINLPMIIEVDNKGAKDLVNNWSIGGRTHHVGVRLNYLRELKEDGVIQVKWIKSEDNVADILTNKLPTPIFKKHIESLGVGTWNSKITNVPGRVLGIRMRDRKKNGNSWNISDTKRSSYTLIDYLMIRLD